MNILIVEDEPLIQKSIQLYLNKIGHKTSVTSKGKDAIEAIINNNFDRIICDLMLKDITGFEVAEESKKKYSASEISDKFLFITAYNNDKVLESVKKYQCKILFKPFKLIELKQLLSDGENER